MIFYKREKFGVAVLKPTRYDNSKGNRMAHHCLK